jgi:WD40 repeat protein
MIYFLSFDGKILWNYTSKCYGQDFGFGEVIDVSSDGQKVIVGACDKIIYFSREGKQRTEFYEGNTNYHYAVSENGQYIFAAGLSSQQKCGSTFAGGDITSIYYAEDVCSYPGTILLYDGFNGKTIWNYTKGFEEEFSDVTMAPDGQYMAAGSNYRKVYYFSRDKELWNYRTKDPVNSIAISSDGQYVAAGTSASEVYLLSKEGKLLWNYTTYHTMRTGYLGVGADRKSYTIPDTFPVSVAVSPDGQNVFVGDVYKDENDNVYSEVYYLSRDGKLLKSFRSDVTSTSVEGIVVSSNGQYLIAMTDGKVYYLSIDGELLWSRYVGWVGDLHAAVSSDGQFVVLGDNQRYGHSKVHYFSRVGTK